MVPGPARFAQVPKGPQTRIVWVFLAPQTTSSQQLDRLTLSERQGHWYVTSPGPNYGITATTFAAFQRQPEYRTVGTTHWQEVTLK